MPSSPFGEHLKREREMRGVSLEEVATATKINTRFLEALESGRWEELPGGAFGRGFVRTAARFLGLNEDDMVAEFALETGGDPQSKPAGEPSRAMPRNYRPAIIAGAIFVLLLIAGGWFAYHEVSVHRHKHAELVAASGVQAPLGASPGTVAPASVDAGGNSGGPAAAGSAPARAASAPAAGSGRSIAAPGRASNGSGENVAPDGGAPAAPATVAPANVGGSESAAPGNAEIASDTKILDLKIDASKTTEVRVIGDGKTLFRGRLHADDSKHFQARNGFEVTSGDSSAVQLALNGQNVSLAGKPGKRGSARLSRKDLKSPAAAPR